MAASTPPTAMDSNAVTPIGRRPLPFNLSPQSRSPLSPGSNGLGAVAAGGLAGGFADIVVTNMQVEEQQAGRPLALATAVKTRTDVKIPSLILQSLLQRAIKGGLDAVINKLDYLIQKANRISGGQVPVPASRPVVVQDGLPTCGASPPPPPPPGGCTILMPRAVPHADMPPELLAKLMAQEHKFRMVQEEHRFRLELQRLQNQSQLNEMEVGTRNRQLEAELEGSRMTTQRHRESTSLQKVKIVTNHFRDEKKAELKMMPLRKKELGIIKKRDPKAAAAALKLLRPPPKCNVNIH